ncbi:MAG: hypothetical protein A6F71_10780 [Cycloclasticus sp. symbiont of Poecilosclerida sp. M]|nr:MAG: hypothetical protein A6F71_10780 [Cycloclasticus sp. symbiont of Poecilosclerida sp. M]
MKLIDSANVCREYPQKEYIDMANSRKGDKEGRMRARIDSSSSGDERAGLQFHDKDHYITL